MLPEQSSDPFGERPGTSMSKSIHLLGGRFHFESDSHELMHLVHAAYAGLPRHRLSSKVPDLHLKLLLSPPRSAGAGKRLGRGGPREPPSPEMLHGPGLLGAAAGSSNFVTLAPALKSALVAVSREMLAFPYHTRYEFIEFAVFTLAARVQQLIPLHAACVGSRGRGVLLMGASGAGKSTAALNCLLQGWDFLSEDSVFVEPQTMLATGVANYAHVRCDSDLCRGPSPEARMLRASPVIRRRSGVLKFEVDLRRDRFRLADAPLKITGIVFLSEKKAGKSHPMKSLPIPRCSRSWRPSRATARTSRGGPYS